MINSDSHKYHYLQRSFILHSYPYKENSLIANILTYEKGRIDVLAKGVKNSKKGIFNLLQPFQQVALSYSYKNNLSILTDVEKISVTTPVLNGKSLYCAYYINELLLRLLPVNETCEDVFHLYEKTLQNLHLNDYLESVLRQFEIQLLSALGYQINFAINISTNQPIEINKSYLFDPTEGPFEPSSQDNITTDKMYPKVSGKTLYALNLLDFNDKNVVKESKILLRLVLQQYLGAKPLKSRDLFKKLYGK